MADQFLSEKTLTFLRGLGRLDVRFMVVGMAAAVMQGSDRGTEDIDLWFSSLSDPGIDKAARAAGGMFAWRNIPPAISGKGFEDIDIVWKCDGLRGFEVEYSKAVEGEILGVAVKALPLHRVIVSKEAADRPKDRAALPSLRATLIAIQATKKVRLIRR